MLTLKRRQTFLQLEMRTVSIYFRVDLLLSQNKVKGHENRCLMFGFSVFEKATGMAGEKAPYLGPEDLNVT